MHARLNEDYDMNTDYNIIHADFVKWLGGNQWLVQNGHMGKYHAVLADPPYGLEFMSKGWDAYTPQNYQAWVTEWARMLLDFVHPGGVLMMFGGTRTYHRLVAGLEDAGWEIYDSIGVQTYQWLYGSGFPKNTSISKMIDKAAGIEREVVMPMPSPGSTRPRTAMGDSWQESPMLTAPATPEAAQWEGYGTALAPSHEPIVLARKPRGGLTYAECALKFGSGALNINGSRVMTGENIKTVQGQSANQQSGKMYTGKDQRNKRIFENNTGRWPKNTILIHHPDCADNECVEACHVRVLGEMSGESVSTKNTIDDKRKNDGQSIFLDGRRNPENSHDDTGTASRFFYQAKSPQWERDAGLNNEPITVGDGRVKSIDNAYQRGETLRRNPHPTLKPIKLCEYLAKLLLPPIDNARLLVPFAGSGSEMIGAMLAGWSHVTGIEMTDEYIPIAEARLNWWSGFDSYEAAKLSATSIQRGQAAEEKKAASGQMSLFDLL